MVKRKKVESKDKEGKGSDEVGENKSEFIKDTVDVKESDTSSEQSKLSDMNRESETKIDVAVKNDTKIGVSLVSDYISSGDSE